MKIIGIDPGSRFIGITILTDGKIEKITQWKFTDKEIHHRYSQIANKLDEYWKVHTDFDAVGIETAFFGGRNAQSGLKLSVIRGIIIGSIYRVYPLANILDITSMQMRDNFKLSRKAEKASIHKAIALDYDYDWESVGEDGRDSAGIAITAYSEYTNALLVSDNMFQG